MVGDSWNRDDYRQLDFCEDCAKDFKKFMCSAPTVKAMPSRCPLCGCTAIALAVDNPSEHTEVCENYIGIVSCNNCGFIGKRGYAATVDDAIDEAIKLWNVFGADSK